MSKLPAAVFALVPVVVAGEVSQVSSLRCKFFARDCVPETSADGGEAERECDGLPAETRDAAGLAGSTSSSFDETEFGRYSGVERAESPLSYVKAWAKVAEAFWGSASYAREV